MKNKIAELKHALGAGARASKYRVNFAIPSTVPVSSQLENASVLCKASSFPSMSIGGIDAFAQGRKIVLPGDTTYTNEWGLTFYTTEDHALRRDLISWMKSADNFQENIHSGNPASIMGELSITQLDSAGNDTATYTFHNVYVSEVAELTVGGDQIDTLLEFDATFTFSDWVVGADGENKPEVANKATKNDVAL